MARYYDENGNLRNFDVSERKRKCPNCKKIYLQRLEEQVPGFRDRDYDICPYCGSENDTSMSYEYHNSKLN